MNGSPVLVVHGGAGSLESEAVRARYRTGVREALEAGCAALERGAHAAVVEAVAYMEAHTIMNAGRGAALDADGRPSLDAGFMDGASRRYGGVAGVTRCMTPVRLAERLHREGAFGVLVGAPGSDALVEELGLPACAPGDLVTDRMRALHEARGTARRGRPWLDTVGAVALDAHGRLAAAVSTGGISHKRRGRIGDSPVVGAGFWADDAAGACVTTGVGEVLLRQGTARRAVQLLAEGATPERACARALDEVLDHDGDDRGVSGLILVAPDGRVRLDHNSPEMSGGWARPGGERRLEHVWRAR